MITQDTVEGILRELIEIKEELKKEPALIDIKEFTQRNNIGEEAARRMVKHEDFPKIKVGNRVKIIVGELDSWLVAHKGESI